MKHPSCFGILDSVFPESADGFRNTPEACLACLHKTECLKSAMKGLNGLKAREKLVDRAYESGMITLFDRWLRKKDLQRKIKQKEKG